MQSDQSNDITVLLQQWRAGDSQAFDQLMEKVYDQLHQLARSAARRDGQALRFETTGLISDAYLKLMDSKVDWQDRAHFFAIASQVMRRVLIDRYRASKAAKRGGEMLPVTLHTHQLSGESGLPLDKLDELLNELQSFDERKCRMLEMHYFAGLSYDDIARVENLSRATVARELKFAKAWLKSELAD